MPVERHQDLWVPDVGDVIAGCRIESLLGRGGFYAEYGVVEAEYVARVPDRQRQQRGTLVVVWVARTPACSARSTARSNAKTSFIWLS